MRLGCGVGGCVPGSGGDGLAVFFEVYGLELNWRLEGEYTHIHSGSFPISTASKFFIAVFAALPATIVFAMLLWPRLSPVQHSFHQHNITPGTRHLMLLNVKEHEHTNNNTPLILSRQLKKPSPVFQRLRRILVIRDAVANVAGEIGVESCTVSVRSLSLTQPSYYN